MHEQVDEPVHAQVDEPVHERVHEPVHENTRLRRMQSTREGCRTGKLNKDIGVGTCRSETTRTSSVDHDAAKSMCAIE